MFVPGDVVQPPSAAATRAMAITTLRCIVTCLLVSDLAFWMSEASASSQPRFAERTAAARRHHKPPVASLRDTVGMWSVNAAGSITMAAVRWVHDIHVGSVSAPEELREVNTVGDREVHGSSTSPQLISCPLKFQGRSSRVLGRRFDAVLRLRRFGVSWLLRKA